MPIDILVVNLVILGSVLSADLGTRAITRLRVLRPVIVSVIAIAIFVKSPQTSGTGLTLELAGLAVGLILGAIGSRLLMPTTKDPRTNMPISIAGASYAAFWIVVIGARLSFTYGAYHWYSNALGRWMATNRVTVNGLTDALILLAIGMVLSRAGRFARVLYNSAPGAASPNAQPQLREPRTTPTPTGPHPHRRLAEPTTSSSSRW